jgi:hypothetical protein
MVGHKYVSEEMKMIALFICGEDFEKFAVIEGISKYLLLLVSPSDYMLKGTFVLNPGFSSHARG